MKKILASLLVLISIQTICFADAETDLHQVYIAKIQAQGVKYNHINFFSAISNGNVQMTEMFLNAGMKPDETLMTVPALYMAISNNQNEIVELLLNNKIDPNKEIGGISPLILAIKHKDAKIVETLIKYGADVNQSDVYESPLSYAIQKKQPKIVELLLNAGAIPDEKALLKALKSKDRYIKDAVLYKFKTMD